MILKRLTQEPYFNRWHDWFAWYPVKARNEHGYYSVVWLEFVRYRPRIVGANTEIHIVYDYEFTELNT